MSKKAKLNLLTLIMFLMLPFTAYSQPAQKSGRVNNQLQKQDKSDKKNKTAKKEDLPYHEPNGYDEIAHRSIVALAIGVVMGLATLGGTIGQGLVGASALNGIAKNPGTKSSMQTMLILIMVLIESIVIYALVIAILLFTKL